MFNEQGAKRELVLVKPIQGLSVPIQPGVTVALDFELPGHDRVVEDGLLEPRARHFEPVGEDGHFWILKVVSACHQPGVQLRLVRRPDDRKWRPGWVPANEARPFRPAVASGSDFHGSTEFSLDYTELPPEPVLETEEDRLAITPWFDLVPGPEDPTATQEDREGSLTSAVTLLQLAGEKIPTRSRWDHASSQSHDALWWPDNYVVKTPFSILVKSKEWPIDSCMAVVGWACSKPRKAPKGTSQPGQTDVLPGYYGDSGASF